jgi:carnitine O-acetyltransferase
MLTETESKHVVVLRRGQFCECLLVMCIWAIRLILSIDWFEVLCNDNRPLLTEREILRNLHGIVRDADELPVHEVARSSIGVLSTENRKTWSSLRTALQRQRTNALGLQIIDNALFIVCLDDAAPSNLGELCSNFLCGTYNLTDGVQVGTCTNRWYDKVGLPFPSP